MYIQNIVSINNIIGKNMSVFICSCFFSMIFIVPFFEVYPKYNRYNTILMILLLCVGKFFAYDKYNK